MKTDGTIGYRRCWSYLSAPLAAYLVVMVPICALEMFLFLTDSPGWMRWSAAGVLVLSGLAVVRGYGRRLVLSDRGVSLAGVGRRIEIAWSRVRRVGVYAPGGIGSTEFAYITTRETPPAGKWDVGPDTLQLQNRPGLLEAIEVARAESRKPKAEN
ncbi:MAG: hypothetical protein ACE5F9_13120 [Phycisphaerae bacterium]